MLQHSLDRCTESNSTAPAVQPALQPDRPKSNPPLNGQVSPAESHPPHAIDWSPLLCCPIILIRLLDEKSSKKVEVSKDWRSLAPKLKPSKPTLVVDDGEGNEKGRSRGRGAANCMGAGVGMGLIVRRRDCIRAACRVAIEGLSDTQGMSQARRTRMLPETHALTLPLPMRKRVSTTLEHKSSTTVFRFGSRPGSEAEMIWRVEENQ